MADDDRTDVSEQPANGSEPGWPLPADQSGAIELGGGGPAGPQRRRRGRIAAAAGAAVAIAAVAVAEAQGPGSPAPALATPAQALAAASQASSTLNSESATLVEQLGSAGTIRGTFADQRSPFLESMAMTEDVAGQHVPISMILTKNEMYLKVGGLPGMPGAATGKWIKIPLTGLGSGSPIASMLQNLTGQNPMSEVRMLSAGGHLRTVGTQTVGGVATTEYAGSFSLADAMKYLPASSRALMGGALKMISGAVRFTVWIDGSHRVRKLTETETIDSVTAHVTITFYRFNQPLAIKVPPASQVVSPPGGSLGPTGI